LYYFTYFFLLVQKNNKTPKPNKTPKKPTGLGLKKTRIFEPCFLGEPNLLHVFLPGTSTFRIPHPKT